MITTSSCVGVTQQNRFIARRTLEAWAVIQMRSRRLHEYMSDLRPRIVAALSLVTRLFHEMLGALGRLPFYLKAFIGLAMLLDFIAVTQWERLSFPRAPLPALPQMRIASQPTTNEIVVSDLSPPALEDRPPPNTWFEIIDPQVQRNGSLSGNGEVLYLYGIKHFSSKTVCTRASGERWACGLQAYAATAPSCSRAEATLGPLSDPAISLCNLSTIGFGTPAGATTPKKLVTTKSATPGALAP
jgi:hypothetical protein